MFPRKDGSQSILIESSLAGKAVYTNFPKKSLITSLQWENK